MGGGSPAGFWLREHVAVMLPDSSRKAPIRGEQDGCWKTEERKAEEGDFVTVNVEASPGIDLIRRYFRPRVCLFGS